MNSEEKQAVMDASASAAITAALIGAAASSATSVGTMAAGADGQPVYAIVTNESDSTFDVVSYGPRHGHSFDSPSLRLEGLPYIEEAFLAAVKGKYGASPTPAEYAAVKAEWITARLFLQYADDCVSHFGGTGDGAGYEQVVAYCTPDEDNAVIALLIRRLPLGNYCAGISLSNGGWFNVEGEKPRAEGIISHIKDVHTDLCKYSEGGAQFSASIGRIKVTVAAPGEKVEVVIQTT